jgi:hypothetical protein
MSRIKHPKIGLLLFTFTAGGVALSALTVLTLLAGCSDSQLSGSYGDKGVNNVQLTFKSDGSVQMTTSNGMSERAKYKVKDKTIEVTEPMGGHKTFRIDDKGCLTGGMIDGTACKQ